MHQMDYEKISNAQVNDSGSKTFSQAWLTTSSDTGGATMGAGDGPGYICHQLLQKVRPSELVNTFGSKEALRLTDEMTASQKLDHWLTTSLVQQSKLSHLLMGHDQVVLFSAEHSLALGNLAGLRASSPHSRIGVVWIDAHADLHSPGTSTTKNPHGMPLAAAMGLDHMHLWRRDLDFGTYDTWKDLQGLMMNHSIAPRDLVYVGLRDFEEEEEQVIAELGIKVVSVEQMRKSQSRALAHEIQRHLQQCDVIYISWDLDSLDATEFSATGLPVAHGLRLYEAHDLISELLRDSRVKVFEITELNPHLGAEHQRQKVVASLADLLVQWKAAPVKMLGTVGLPFNITKS